MWPPFPSALRQSHERGQGPLSVLSSRLQSPLTINGKGLARSRQRQIRWRHYGVPTWPDSAGELARGCPRALVRLVVYVCAAERAIDAPRSIGLHDDPLPRRIVVQPHRVAAAIAARVADRVPAEPERPAEDVAL